MCEVTFVDAPGGVRQGNGWVQVEAEAAEGAGPRIDEQEPAGGRFEDGVAADAAQERPAGLLAQLRRLAGWLAAGELLAERGLPLTVRWALAELLLSSC